LKFDVVVVGAGIAGTFAAKTVSKLGLNVCLLERKPTNRIGEKVCGDGIERPDLDELGISMPKGDEVENRFNGVNLFAPDTNICISLKREGYVVNRLKFGQYLLKNALNAGSEFRDEIMVLGVILTKGKVVGVKVKDVKSGKKEKIKGKVVIDASGLYSPLRKTINNPYIEREFNMEDTWVCFRQIIEFREMDFNSQQLHIYFSHGRVPREYWWFFPKSETRANLGVCIRGNAVHNVKACYNRYFKSEIQSKIRPPIKIIHQGGGVVSTRRPIWSMVGEGILFTGDAACLANPIHGGGIGPAMRSGIYAGEAVSDAIEQDDYSIDGLWEYNKRFALDQGGLFVAVDLLRVPFQRFTDAEVNYVVHKVLSSQDLLNLLDGRIDQIDLSAILEEKKEDLNQSDILQDLLLTFDQMKRVKKLYEKYPDRPNFDRWRGKILKIYAKVKRAIPEKLVN